MLKKKITSTFQASGQKQKRYCEGLYNLERT